MTLGNGKPGRLTLQIKEKPRLLGKAARQSQHEHDYIRERGVNCPSVLHGQAVLGAR